jgi:hypothetical protein
LFHLGYLWTLVLVGVCLVVICSNFDSRFDMSIVVFLWCIHNIRTANVSMRGSLLSSGDMVGSVYIIVSSGKCMTT